MNERELLENAAKAAGIVGAYQSLAADFAGNFHEGISEHFGFRWWNPLTDDGDALRLAVKLRMDILPGVDGALAFVSRNHPKRHQAEEPYGDDPGAATRRAIVRAAAEIGKAMP